jgi:hypothetical protein
MKLKEHISKAHGGSQKHFADAEGFSENQVSRWIKYGCIWFEGAVYKQQSKPVAEGAMNATAIFADSLDSLRPTQIQLALVGSQLLMRIPDKDDSKLVVIEVSESIAKDLSDKETFTDSYWPEAHNSYLTYDEFIAKYKIDSVVPYNAKDAF